MVALIGLNCVGPANAAAQKDYGKQGEPLELVIGYQPYYTEVVVGRDHAGQEVLREVSAEGLER